MIDVRRCLERILRRRYYQRREIDELLSDLSSPQHNHDQDYSPVGHTHPYSPNTHDHDQDYSPVGHTHSPNSASVYHDANQSIPNSTTTLLSFNTEEWDTGDFHVTSPNSRLTVPTTGRYLIVGNISYEFASGGYRAAFLTVNGSTVGEVYLAPATGPTEFNISRILNLVEGQYVELYARQTAGSAINVLPGSSRTYMQILRVSQ